MRGTGNGCDICGGYGGRDGDHGCLQFDYAGGCVVCIRSRWDSLSLSLSLSLSFSLCVCMYVCVCACWGEGSWLEGRDGDQVVVCHLTTQVAVVICIRSASVCVLEGSWLEGRDGGQVVVCGFDNTGGCGSM